MTTITIPDRVDVDLTAQHIAGRVTERHARILARGEKIAA